MITLNGEKLEVIDFHRHMGPSTPTYGASEVLKDIDAVGIDRTVGFPTASPTSDYSERNNFISQEMKKSSDRIIGFCRVNPWLGGEKCAKEVARSVKELGLKGLKLSPLFEFFYPNAPEMYSIYETARKNKIPILFHSGMNPNSAPALIADAAMEFPEVTFIIAHIGTQVWAEDAIAMAKRVDNLCVDTSSAIDYNIKKAIKTIGAERVLFGTDSPFSSAGLELAKVTEYLKLPTDQLRLILAENAKRIVGIK